MVYLYRCCCKICVFRITGCIEFENLTVRYRAALEPALKDVSIKVNSHEKIGVAGRTGSGKSTLMLCLCMSYLPIGCFKSSVGFP